MVESDKRGAMVRWAAAKDKAREIGANSNHSNYHHYFIMRAL